MRLIAGRRRPVRAAGDGGFTLVELMVALLLVGVVVSSLIALQIGSLQTVTLAKQRQTATALANQAVEQIRALPYATLSQGLRADELTSDPGWIIGERLKAPWDEKVVTSDEQTNAALTPHVSDPRTIEAATYTVRRYVTRPKDATGADLTTNNDVWLTIVVQWTSSVTDGQTKQVVLRNRVVSPAGCKGIGEHPYAGPRQACLFAESHVSGVTLTVSSDDPTNGLFAGTDVTQAVLVLSSIGSGLENEQFVSAYGRAVTPGVIKGDATSSGLETVQVRSDIDLVTGTASAPSPVTLSQSTSGPEPPVSLPGGDLLQLSQAGVSGGQVAAGAVVQSGTGCQDLMGAALTAARSCGSAWAQPAGEASLVLNLAGIAGSDLAAVTLGSVTAGTSPDRAYSARFGAGGTGHCGGTSGDGCAAAGASRSLGEVTIGGLPEGGVLLDGTQIPENFALVTLTEVSETVSAEIGEGSANPSTNQRFEAKRTTGTLRLWNGTEDEDEDEDEYETIPLAGLTAPLSLTLPDDVVASYQAADDDGRIAVQVTVTGEVMVGGPTVQKTSGNCEPDTCVGEAQLGAIVITLHYKISTGGGIVTSFDLVADLGSLAATTSYRAMPDA